MLILSVKSRFYVPASVSDRFDIVPSLHVDERLSAHSLLLIGHRHQSKEAL